MDSEERTGEKSKYRTKKLKSAVGEKILNLQ